MHDSCACTSEISLPADIVRVAAGLCPVRVTSCVCLRTKCFVSYILYICIGMAAVSRSLAAVRRAGSRLCSSSAAKLGAAVAAPGGLVPTDAPAYTPSSKEVVPAELDARVSVAGAESTCEPCLTDSWTAVHLHHPPGLSVTPSLRQFCHLFLPQLHRDGRVMTLISQR